MKFYVITNIIMICCFVLFGCSQSPDVQQRAIDLIQVLEANKHSEVFSGMVVARRGEICDGYYRVAFLYPVEKENLQFFFPTYSVSRDSMSKVLNDSLAIVFANHFAIDTAKANAYVLSRAKEIGVLFCKIGIYEVDGAFWFGNSIEYKITPKHSLYFVPDNVVFKRSREKIIQNSRKIRENWYFFEW